MQNTTYSTDGECHQANEPLNNIPHPGIQSPNDSQEEALNTEEGLSPNAGGHPLALRGAAIAAAIEEQYKQLSGDTYALKDLMQYRYCQSCREIKPPRTHHCSVCSRCYLRMDHHCPWVGSCVAFNNHKLFILFLTYTTSGCAYTGLTCGIDAISLFDSDAGFAPGTSEHCYMAALLASSLCVAIICLLVSHIYFALTS